MSSTRPADKFPANVFELESFALFLTDAYPHFAFQINLHDLINMYNISGDFDKLLGLDGNYRKSEPSIYGNNPGHIAAAKGT
jgi:hypothetical protein